MCMQVDSFPLSWEGPIRSYGAAVDMRGKTVLITGGNAGIGFETAARLAVEGASVMIAGRSADRMGHLPSSPTISLCACR